ncbi:MAG: hypothetical protein JNK45_03515 [Myxococcales bacterium]|nr:hypothetical protein [Myxococcales bacterium]
MADAIDEATLERMRRGVPLRLSAAGSWWFGDEPVTHVGLARALTGGLDLSDGGEPIVRLGHQYCYVTLDDTPLRVVGLREDDAGTLWLRLDDGRDVVLDTASLVEDRERGLRCAVPSRDSGRPLAARFGNRAQADLARWIRWPDGAARPSFVHGGVERVIPGS